MNSPVVVQTLRRYAIYILAALASTSCASGPRNLEPGLGPAPLPSYRKGTTFVYSDGSWETVMEATAQEVTWRNHRRDISIGSADFTHRRRQWENNARRGTREFGPRDDLIIQSTASLWPLRVGNAADYSETGRWGDKEDGSETSYRAGWSCAVDGVERVAVMAGEFDTWKIVCKRYHIFRNKSNLREVKTWYYAPAVGHYVLTTSSYSYQKKPRRLELIAVLPSLDNLPANARREIIHSFQKALEFTKSGESVRWSGSATGVSVETIPAGTYRTPDGSFSRRYVQKLILPDGQRTYYGMAIRNAEGVWSVPRR